MVDAWTDGILYEGQKIAYLSVMLYDFDSAQICLNGHLINRAYSCLPELNRNFCTMCGQKTITNCIQCDSIIKGSAKIGDQVFNDVYLVPKFCDSCGKPYPWTEATQEAAYELIELSDDLTDSDKKNLRDSVTELVRDTPKTSVAVIKFKKYTSKAGTLIANGLRDLLVDVVSEAVKKSIWPKP